MGFVLAALLSLWLAFIPEGFAHEEPDEAAVKTPPPSIRGFYAGGGIGASNVYSYTDSCWGCWGDSEYGDEDFAYTFVGGYRFMRFFALEAGYLDSGTPGWDEALVFVPDLADFYNVRADIDLQSYQLTGLAILPFLNIWEAYLRGGVTWWDGDSSQTLTRIADNQVIRRSLSDSGTEFVLGIGGGVTLAGHWHLRIDYVYFPIDDSLLALGPSDDAYSDIFTAQINYRFGKGW